ncbi:hypothetical protein jhhlp_002153 [Lomentospora prolificans]|uniref:Uncharacterized protein n=1 Tax=Lomentospora prolificans TaxID=41688 RepID=A0A2N3NDH4_9PEZI|nr:hypothetical protein jhhlp_002153 [Lomentospora prolificans]
MEMNSDQPKQGTKLRKWPKITDDLSPAVKVGSDSSTGGESIGCIVKKASRSFSSKASSLFRKSSERTPDDSDLPLPRTSRNRGGLRVVKGWGNQKGDSPSVMYEKITSSSDGGISSIRFSSKYTINSIESVVRATINIYYKASPGRLSGQRPRNISNALKTCRKRLSMGSIKGSLAQVQGHDINMGLVAPLIQTRTSSEPPRIRDLSDVSNEDPSSFRNDLDEALEDIVKRGERNDYIVGAKPCSFGPYLVLPVRRRAATFSTAINILGDISNRKTQGTSMGKDAQNALRDFDFGSRSDFATRLSTYNNVRTTSNGRTDSQERTEKHLDERNEVLESAKRSLRKSSPETAKIMGQIQDMPPRARDRNVSVGGGIRARVKMAWPWIQRTHGTLRVFDTHAAALSSLQYEIDNVNDLAFYNVDSQTYFLQPTCFPIDKDDDEVGRARGFELVSISFLNGTTEQNAVVDILMPDEPRAERPRLIMTVNEEDDYVIVDFKDDTVPECPLARGDIDNMDEFISAQAY